MKKINAWQYHMVWHTNKCQKILIGVVGLAIKEILVKLCDESKLNLSKVIVMPDSVEILIDSDIQLNIVKVLKGLQKKLSKSLYKKFPELRQIGKELWDSRYLVSTINNGSAEANLRIEKMLEGLWSAEYYDLDEGVTDDLDALKAYLVSRDLAVVEYGEQVFLVDREALKKEINLNCFECTKIYKYGCCSGSPCSLSPKNQKLLKMHLPQIAEEVKSLDEHQYKDIVASGGFIKDDGAITECNGRCSLLVEHEGVWKCISHKYALEQHIPVYDLCPLSCLMYPLEIIELITNRQKKIILLTSALTEEFAKEFGRWGSYKSLDVDLRCIHKEAHNEIFKEEDYKPVYKVNKNLLMHEFGYEVYKGIEKTVVS